MYNNNITLQKILYNQRIGTKIINYLYVRYLKCIRPFDFNNNNIGIYAAYNYLKS